MATIDGELIQMPNEVGNVNVVKDIVITKLFDDGVISDEHLEKYRDRHHVIIIKPSWFRGVMKRLGIKSKSYEYRFVKFGFSTEEES